VNLSPDGTKPVRAGEELDLEKLSTFVHELGMTGAITVEQFPGGHSNLTYCVRAGDREMVLRRPPVGSKVKSAHDMGREVTVLSKLAPVYSRAPKVFAYEATGDVRWFDDAAWCGDQILQRFGDPRTGFFLTPDGGDRLVTRPREILDTATPSGNAAAAELLARLAIFTGEADREAAAEQSVAVVAAEARRHPSAFGHALGVIDLLEGPAHQIAIVGPTASSVAPMRAEVDRRFLPNAVLAIAQGHAEAPGIPLLHGRTAIDGRATAYVCERFVCAAPTNDPAVLGATLDPEQRDAAHRS
jgi:hypothetical protein